VRARAGVGIDDGARAVIARSRRAARALPPLAFLLGSLAARAALAQYGGGMGQPGGMPAPPAGQEPKEEGPAEAAPEEEHPTDLEPLGGYAEQGRKKMQIFELNGYLRVRTDYMHNFFLGQGYTNVTVPSVPGVPNSPPLRGLPPFPLPLGCPVPTGTVTASACGIKGMGGANMRLRLEPTLNVTDQVRVHAQIDALDNTLMGSTPDSLVGIGRTTQDNLPGVAPLPLLYTTQDPPEVGQNGFVSSVRAKQAWGEVDSEFGSIRFGRMPWNWGRGMAYNNGSCPDCDGETVVDRLMALTQLYGHQFALAYDFGSQGLTSQTLLFGRDDPSGYPIDLSQDDDVIELMASVTKIDTPAHLRERIDRGDVVVNYGLQLVYRSQQDDVQVSPGTSTMTMPTVSVTGPGQLPTQSIAQQPNNFTPINGLLVTPDLWFKLWFKQLTVEFEGIGVFGKVDHAGPLAVDANERLTFREFGWVLASQLQLYRDTFFVGFETGGATGDQAEDRNRYLNYRWKFVQQPTGDSQINDFKFSPEYHVDEIFWRQIVGTVTNAIYFKPSAAYWFDLQQNRQIGLSGSVIYSMAPVPVSTPGNALSYGIEMDLGLSYRNAPEGFYAGFVWGVFWPLAALDRPEEIWGTMDASGATAAQTLRLFLGIRY
jgi:uncharacterized protein (TIGR04551 family)